MADMMFDLVCYHCGRRDQRRWETRKSVTVTLCPMCKRGMSVVGIAFFVANQTERVAA
jgi:phage terminase large subunit-like protein